jgi:hypothetical protein
VTVRTIALAALAAISFATAAQAGEIKGKAVMYWTYSPTKLAQGQTYGYDVGRALGPFVAADGSVTSLDCLTWNSATGHGGSCTDYAANPADTYWFDYDCNDVVTPTPAGALFACTGKAEVKGGTGKYAAIKGTNTHTLTITGALPDGTLVGYTTSDNDFSY